MALFDFTQDTKKKTKLKTISQDNMTILVNEIKIAEKNNEDFVEPQSIVTGKQCH